MRSPNPCLRQAFLVSISLFGLQLSAARAADRFWTNPAGGNWNVLGNWDTGIPGPGDVAHIDLDGTYTVTVNVAVSIDSLVLGAASGTQTLTVSNSLTLATASSVGVNGRFDQSSTLTGAGDLTVDGTFTWTGGTMSGAGTTFVNGGINLTGGTTLARTLTVSSATTQTGSLTMGTGAVLNNQPGASWSIQGNFGFIDGAPLETINNFGSIAKDSGTGTTTINSRFFNSGTVVSNAGRIHCTGGGQHTGSFTATTAGTSFKFDSGGALNCDFEPASSLTAHTVLIGVSGQTGETFFGGTWNVPGSTASVTVADQLTLETIASITDIGDNWTVASGGVSFLTAGAPYAFNTFDLQAGALNFANASDNVSIVTYLQRGILSGPASVTVAGQMTWGGTSTGGTIQGPGTINANGGLLFPEGGSVKHLSGGRIFNNAALCTFQGTNTAGPVFSGNSVFNNLSNGVMEVSSDIVRIFNAGAAGDGTFNNIGTWRLNGTAGTIDCQGTIVNTGLIDLQAGTLNINNTGTTFTQTAGETRLNGGNLSLPAPVSTMSLQGGSLTGSGLVTGNVNNTGGTVSCGLSPGQINITGNYTQGAGATLAIELGGLSVATQYDRLAISGSATLAGTLSLTALTGAPFNYAPAPGDQFQIMTFGSRSGVFSSLPCAAIGGVLVRVTHSPADVQVKLFPAPTGDANCDGCLSHDDADAMALALVDPSAYATAYPGCSIGNSDVNADALVNGLDVQAFVNLLTQP